MRRSIAVILLGAFCLGTIVSACTKAPGRITSMPLELHVSPQEVLVGDPIRVTATGLPPGKVASLTVSGQDQFGNLWSSSASFRADIAGTIDPSRDAPVAGTYSGVDPSGLFWSMSCRPAGERISPFVVLPAFTVGLSLDGQEKVSRVVTRIARRDLERRPVSNGIEGVFLMPLEIKKPTPALIVLGGSEGGVNEGWAAVIASKTRLPTLALGYFGAKGLPPTLENIPLETIEKALDWLVRQPNVADRVGVIGASRGGELAMLAATLFPRIEAVVGYTPSGLIWQGIGAGEAPAWTYRGKPFPYLAFMEDEAARNRFREAQQKGTPYLDAPSFLYSLGRQQERIEAATIQVERSKAAFLLIGNPGDGVWPSDLLSRTAVDRLRTHRHPRTYELLTYDDGGHMLIPYPYYPTTLRQFYLPTIRIWEGLGGTAVGAARAAGDSWPKVVGFLRRELRAE